MPRKRSKYEVKKNQQRNNAEKQGKSSISKSLVNKVLQKDIVSYILSFLAHNTFIPRIANRYYSPYFKVFCDEEIYDAAYYIEKKVNPQDMTQMECGNDPAAFNVLPVALKRVNKVFNQCVCKLSHLIFCFDLDLNMEILSNSMACSSLKQLYWVQDLSQGNVQNKIDALQHFNFPNLEILQIHYLYFCFTYEKDKHELNISLDTNNLPKLHTLILGPIFDDFNSHKMKVNKLELDLDIIELRIQRVAFQDLESLRLSLAKCPLIEVLILQLDRFGSQSCLHSLCLQSVELIFFQSDWLNSLSVYAPNLEVVQFYFCDKLDKFIILERISNKFKFMHRYIKCLTNTECDDNEESMSDVNIDETPLQIGFDNCYEDLESRHWEKFTVIKNGQKWNEKCSIKFSWLHREMLVWPYPKFL